MSELKNNDKTDNFESKSGDIKPDSLPNTSNSSMNTDKPKLYYFQAYARAEPIRLAFTYAKKDFEDIQLTRDEFNEKKQAGFFPFGQMPVLEWNGKKYPESRSIMRYVCQKLGYYPSDVEDMFNCEAACDYNDDIVEKIMGLYRIKDPEEKKKAEETWINETLPVMFKLLERHFLASTKDKKHFVGDKMTMADFWVLHLYLQFGSHHDAATNEKLFADTPDLKNYFLTRAEDFKDYLATRPKRPF